MIKMLFFFLALLRTGLKERRELALENLALRQQLAILNRARSRLRLRKSDRFFWI
jgi:cell shape-determining protein MreC